MFTTYKQKFTTIIKIKIVKSINYSLFQSLKMSNYFLLRHINIITKNTSLISNINRKKKKPPNIKIFLMVLHHLTEKFFDFTRHILDKTQNDVMSVGIQRLADEFDPISGCSNGRQKPLWPLSSLIIEYLIIPGGRWNRVEATWASYRMLLIIDVN